MVVGWAFKGFKKLFSLLLAAALLLASSLLLLLTLPGSVQAQVPTNKITKTANPSTVAVGQQIVFTIKVHDSILAGQYVDVVDPLALNLTVETVTPSSGTCEDKTENVSADSYITTVRCSNVLLDSNGNATVTVIAVPTPTAYKGTVANEALFFVSGSHRASGVAVTYFTVGDGGLSDAPSNAVAQVEETKGSPGGTAVEQTSSGPLPGSGGLAGVSVLLPAAALLVGSGVLTYAVVRRHR